MKFKIEKTLLILVIILGALLRITQLDKFPSGLNADEAAIGYNAYSLLQTGRDEHNQVWPLVFRSFDDYKPPLYFYLTLPFVATLGLNVWAVRLPSAILGVLSLFLAYKFSNQLFPSAKIRLGKHKLSVGLFTALILAFSPWHLIFTRGGWEVNVATSLLLLSLTFLWERPRRYALAAIALVACLYTYHALRLILPFILSWFVLIHHKDIFSAKGLRSVAIPIIVGIILLTPLLMQFMSPSGSARFSGVSVFADEGPYWEALALRSEHEGQTDFLATRLLHNKFVTYPLRIAKNYLSHFSPHFIFITGDEIERSRIVNTGLALITTLPFLAIGFILLANSSRKSNLFILGWFLLAPLAAAITFQSPHALRAQNMVIPLSIISAYGLVMALSRIPRAHIAILGLLVLFSYESIRLSHHYFKHNPWELPTSWEFGFDQLSSYIAKNESKYDQIIISDKYDQPYILMAFFLKYPPDKFQQEIKLEPRDKFGFSTVRRFGKYEFRPVNQTDLSNSNLVVATGEQILGEPIHTILFPNGQPAFRLYSLVK